MPPHFRRFLAFRRPGAWRSAASWRTQGAVSWQSGGTARDGRSCIRLASTSRTSFTECRAARAPLASRWATSLARRSRSVGTVSDGSFRRSTSAIRWEEITSSLECPAALMPAAPQWALTTSAFAGTRTTATTTCRSLASSSMAAGRSDEIPTSHVRPTAPIRVATFCTECRASRRSLVWQSEPSFTGGTATAGRDRGRTATDSSPSHAHRPLRARLSGTGLQDAVNGSGWSIQNSHTLSVGSLDGLSCLSTDACVAVGSYISRAGLARPIAETTIGQ